MDYKDTLELTMTEVADHLEWIMARRKEEWKAAFGKK